MGSDVPLETSSDVLVWARRCVVLCLESADEGAFFLPSEMPSNGSRRGSGDSNVPLICTVYRNIMCRNFRDLDLDRYIHVCRSIYVPVYRYRHSVVNDAVMTYLKYSGPGKFSTLRQDGGIYLCAPPLPLRLLRLLVIPSTSSNTYRHEILFKASALALFLIQRVAFCGIFVDSHPAQGIFHK